MTTLVVFICGSIVFKIVRITKCAFLTLLFLDQFKLWSQILGGYDWGMHAQFFCSRCLGLSVSRACNHMTFRHCHLQNLFESWQDHSVLFFSYLGADLNLSKFHTSAEICTLNFGAIWGVLFQNGGILAVSDKVTSKKYWYPSVFLSLSKISLMVIALSMW